MTNWTTGVFRSNGIDIQVLRTGGAKPPLLLLHGLMGSGACWTPQARALEHEYDVLMPDGRGHGGSGAPSDGYSYNDLAADVAGLIQQLNLAAPVLLGHSMGGMTAAVVAAKFPRLIRGLVLADPTFISPEWQREVFESDVAEQHRKLLDQDKLAALSQLRSRRNDRSPELVELQASARLQTCMSAFEVLRPPNPDYRNLVRAIEVPTLLLCADGGVVSLETARELHGLNPRIQIEQIKNAGHGLQYDQPERFAAMVQSFLRALTASPVRA